MKKRTKKILMIGGGVLIAYLLYKHFTKKNKPLTVEEADKKMREIAKKNTPSDIRNFNMRLENQAEPFPNKLFLTKPVGKSKIGLNTNPYIGLGNEVQDSILRSATINKDVPKYVQPYSQNIQIMMPNGEFMTQAVTQKMIDDNPDLEVFYQKNGYITSDQWQTAKGNISGRMPTGEAIF